MAVGDRTNLGGTAYDRLRILTSYRNIAMVGLSSNPYQPSSFAGIYLQANGYNVIPVNPSQAGKTILDQRVYGRVDEIDKPVDIVDVFRPAADAPEIARQAAAVGARALWLQLDIRSDKARRIAEAAGMDYIEDECTGVVASLHRIRKSAA
jgi:uncharacterized protein